jgi:hypothetical protein
MLARLGFTIGLDRERGDGFGAPQPIVARFLLAGSETDPAADHFIWLPVSF